VVFDNGVYGGMGETATARRADLAKMAEGAGIAHTATLRTIEEYEKALRAALAAPEFRFLVAKVERDDTLPFTGNYIKRSERGMKESFVDALKRLPDYPGER
jgi:thiamine pyrophosphate-dependent acetolactate synthase large subunit-like protein